MLRIVSIFNNDKEFFWLWSMCRPLFLLLLLLLLADDDNIFFLSFLDKRQLLSGVGHRMSSFWNLRNLNWKKKNTKKANYKVSYWCRNFTIDILHNIYPYFLKFNSSIEITKNGRASISRSIEKYSRTWSNTGIVCGSGSWFPFAILLDWKYCVIVVLTCWFEIDCGHKIGE